MFRTIMVIMRYKRNCSVYKKGKEAINVNRVFS